MTTWSGVTVPTFAAGDTTTVPTNLNILRDALKAASEAWTSFGTGANWTASTTAPVLGTGTWVGHYRQVNKAVDFWVRITMGGTTTFGAGVYQIVLPVAPFTTHPAHFDALYTDTSAGLSYRGMSSQITSSTKVNLLVDSTTAGGPLSGVTPTVPFTWATTDLLEVWGSYEAA